MPDRPAPAGPGEVALATQQERLKPVPGAHQVRAQILAAADQVTQLFLLLDRDPDQPQFTSGQQPRQPDRVALVGLDPIARAALDAARRADRHLDPLSTGAADQPVARRPGLIDGPQRPRQLTQHLEDFPRAAVDPARDHLPGDIVKDRHGAGVRVNVQPDPTHTVRHGRRLHVWSRPRAQSSTCRTPRNARGVDQQPSATAGRHPYRVWMRACPWPVHTRPPRTSNRSVGPGSSDAYSARSKQESAHDRSARSPLVHSGPLASPTGTPTSVRKRTRPSGTQVARGD
jgi:hypothetical protein